MTSGAVGLGAERLRCDPRRATLAEKQACAAVGQSRLMALYQDAFRQFDIEVAQVLLTEDDFADAVRARNLATALNTLLAFGAIPIINENDVVSTVELEQVQANGTEHRRIFGDNDMLSALLARKIRAEVLLLLSDVDGVHTHNPALIPGAEVIPVVADVTPEIMEGVDTAAGRGRGGMASKLKAAQLASQAGVTVVIANGRTPSIIDRLVEGERIGTVFPARKSA